MESNQLITRVATEISNAMEARVTIVLASMVRSLLDAGVSEETLEDALQTAHVKLIMRKIEITVMDTLAAELAARDARIKELEALRDGNETTAKRYETGDGRPAPDASAHGAQDAPSQRLGRSSEPPQAP